jgi:hypothetical protein
MYGSGMPVMGIMPIVIPAFWRIWNAHMATRPAAISAPNMSRLEEDTDIADDRSAR